MIRVYKPPLSNCDGSEICFDFCVVHICEICFYYQMWLIDITFIQFLREIESLLVLKEQKERN